MKRKVMVVSLMIAISSTAVAANTCDSITEINALYRSVAEKKATDIHIKRLQQEVGVVADGKWGRMSEAAYTALLKRCDSYSYPTDVVQIGNATITDFVSEKTVFEQLKVPVCTNQRLPIYGQVQAPKDPGAVIGGAIAGGVIGKIVTDNDGGAAVGALIGGAIANENQQNNTVTKVIGYESKTVCKDSYVDMPARTEKGYAYSTIQFEVDGVSYTLEFKKR
jgi:uncharacterized protein YcfJ